MIINQCLDVIMNSRSVSVHVMAVANMLGYQPNECLRSTFLTILMHMFFTLGH